MANLGINFFIVLFAFVVSFSEARPSNEAKIQNLTPNCAQINFMKAEINKIYNDVFLHTAGLRLGFHDCIGGCDGCLNLRNPSNAGLAPIVSALETCYVANNFTEFGVSRADFWALASTVSVERGVDIANQKPSPQCKSDCSVPMPCFIYAWGRKDCPTAPETDDIREFPEPNMSADEMFDYFKRTFGFNKQEVVALMGAHTLGGARLDDSGYSGVWKPQNPNSFDNSFYKLMLDANVIWKNIDVGTKVKGPRWEWIGDSENFRNAPFNESMMFNTDFELFFNLTLDESGRVTCTLDPKCEEKKTCGKEGVCAKSSTYAIALLYSKNQAVWINDFQLVFEKMIRNGYSNTNLKENSGTCDQECKVAN